MTAAAHQLAFFPDNLCPKCAAGSWERGSTRLNAVLRILSSKILVNAAIVSLNPSPFTTVAVVPPQKDCIPVQSHAANKAITVPVTWLRLAVFGCST